MLLDPCREQLVTEFHPSRLHPFDVECPVASTVAEGVSKEVVAGQQLPDVPFGPVGLVSAFACARPWDGSILLVAGDASDQLRDPRWFGGINDVQGQFSHEPGEGDAVVSLDGHLRA